MEQQIGGFHVSMDDLHVMQNSKSLKNVLNKLYKDYFKEIQCLELR